MKRRLLVVNKKKTLKKEIDGDAGCRKNGVLSLRFKCPYSASIKPAPGKGPIFLS